MIREGQARSAALYRYAQAHDRFSELEQLYTATGNAVEAEGAHDFALMLLRAYKNEVDDVPPIDPADGGRNDR